MSDQRWRQINSLQNGRFVRVNPWEEWPGFVTLFFVQSLREAALPRELALTLNLLWYFVKSCRRRTLRKSRLQAARARLDDESAIATLLTQ